MLSTAFHSVDMLATQDLEEVKGVQASLLQALEEQTKIDLDEYKVNIEHQANIISRDTVQLEMLKISRDIQTEMKAVKNNNKNHNNNNGNNNNKNTDTSWRNKFCWSHGATGHKCKD